MQDSFLKTQGIFDVLFQAASEGIIVVDSNQHIIAANDATEHMFGYQKEEILGKSLEILIPKKYHHNHHQHFDKFLQYSEKRQMGHGRELYGAKKDGNLFPVEVGLNPFSHEGENYVMSLIIDITVRKETQQQIEDLNIHLEDKIKLRTSELSEIVEELQKLNVDLETEIKKRTEAERKIKSALQKEKELNELKTKFLSLVSHEFKTPLSGILTSATLVEKYTKEDQQARREKHLLTIRNKVHYLNNILNDFLSIERLDSGRGQYKFGAFSLKNFINDIVYNANFSLKEGQEIIYPHDIADKEIVQDEKILELILTNLLGNAIKYSPEHTIINFRVDIKDSSIYFEVEDQGRGIPEKDQKHIFERYFRAENALLDQGTGIGLNIARTHLKNLGGDINFKSVEGKGSLFKVRIPYKHSDGI